MCVYKVYPFFINASGFTPKIPMNPSGSQPEHHVWSATIHHTFNRFVRKNRFDTYEHNISIAVQEKIKTENKNFGRENRKPKVENFLCQLFLKSKTDQKRPSQKFETITIVASKVVQCVIT